MIHKKNRHINDLGATALILAATLFVSPSAAQYPAFVGRGTGLFGLQQASVASTPEFADLDGDGDLDVLSGSFYGPLRFFRNTGNSSNPHFAAPLTNPFGLAQNGYVSHPALGDLDGDGDLDLVVGRDSGGIRFCRNSGNSTNPLFAASQSNFAGLTNAGAYAAPAFADIDHDGDLDLLFGGSGGGFHFFLNTGNSTAPAFGNSAFNPMGLTSVYNLSSPSFMDIEGDGDLDLIVGTMTTGFELFENTGSPSQPRFDAPVTNPFGLDHFSFRQSPAIGDLDGDGDLDLLCGEAYGYLYFFENTLDLTPPTLLSGIAALDPLTTDRRVVRFRMRFSEPVSDTFTVRDIGLTGTLAPDASVMMESEGQYFTNSGLQNDPFYVVAVMLLENDPSGTIGIRINGFVSDPSGNTLTVPVNSPLYTLGLFPAGDVNKDGAFNIADVALLGDANLGLVTLP